MDPVMDPIHGARLGNDGGIDAYFMDRALALAWRAAGRTEPNPLVGAVVVRDGRVIGEGYHEACGESHAEVVALSQAGEQARGATLYTTLEPCAHYGCTPPCVDHIVASGVRRVVAATADPDPRVNRKGLEFLQAHGIDVTLGCRAEPAVVLNLRYFKRKLGMGPAVTVKMATTLDGRIASMRDRQDTITGSAVQRFVHELRATHSAVAVGLNTVIVDEPRLDCRLLERVSDPMPVVFDSRIRVPRNCRWAKEQRRFFVIALEAGVRADPMDGTSGEVVGCVGRNGRVCVAAAVERLGEREIDSVLVEGGGELFTSFLEARAWDVMHIVVAPKLFGPQGVPLVNARVGSLLDAVAVDVKQIGDDYRVTYFRTGTLEPMLSRLT